MAWLAFFSDDGRPVLRVSPWGQAAVALCAAGILLIGTFAAGWLKTFSDARSRDVYAVNQASPVVVAQQP
jgi:hypothetical protein